MKAKNQIKLLSVFIVSCLLFFMYSCDPKEVFDPTAPVMDIDGNVYTTVTIGTQIWMVENLKTTRFQNGDSIKNVTDDKLWKNLSSAAYCNYMNDTIYAKRYGRLYNWYALNSGILAPTGWRIATDDDWKKLKAYLIDNNATKSDSIAKALAAGTNWAVSLSKRAVGNDSTLNNSSGFTAFPGGLRKYDGIFSNISQFGGWWSAPNTNSANTSYWYLESGSCLLLDMGYYPKSTGFSVRCVRD